MAAEGWDARISAAAVSGFRSGYRPAARGPAAPARPAPPAEVEPVAVEPVPVKTVAEPLPVELVPVEPVALEPVVVRQQVGAEPAAVARATPGPSRRRAAALAGGLVAAGLALAVPSAAALLSRPPAAPPSATVAAGRIRFAPPPTRATASPATPRAAPARPARPLTVPARVAVDAIGVDARVVRLDLRDDGSLDTPDRWSDVGWFAGGALPGAPGAAVLVGHVDSTDGPAVFYDLRRLVPGDEVVVTSADGTRRAFVVERARRYPKSDLPWAEVLAPTARAELRLVTCAGEFDRRRRHYRDNLVVFAVAR